MPEDVEKCVRSIQSDNPDMAEDTAYAICNEMDNKGELEDVDDNYLETFQQMNGRENAHRVSVTRFLNNGDQDIKRLEEDSGKVRYTNIMLLAPGEWTDAASRQTIYYAPDAISRSADNWIDPRSGDEIEKAPLNHYHEHDVPAENVGHIPVDTTYTDTKGRLFGDVVFHMRTQRSEEMDELMSLSMEEGGQEGLGGISVEIPDDETKYDDDRGMERMTEMWFSGAGLVMQPASAKVAFEEQSERVTALADGSTAERQTLYLDGGTTKAGGNTQGDMQDQDDRSDLIRRLKELQDDAEDTIRALQEETDMALSLIESYLEDDENSGDDDVSALQEWANETADDEMANALGEVIEAFLDATDMEMGEASISELQDWVEDAGTEDEGEAEDGEEDEEERETEHGEDDEDDDEDEDNRDMEIDEIASTLESVVDTVEETVEAMNAKLSAVEEENQELRETVNSMDKRLSDISEEPQPKSLAGGEGTGTEDTEAGETSVGMSRRGRYLERTR